MGRKRQLLTFDIAAEISHLRKKIINLNVINIFDINAKTFLLKLGRSGDEGEKLFLVLESGMRLHITQYDRNRADFPSNFNVKLRRHIRGRRLTDVRQLGLDRIIDFTFGKDTTAVHLLLEIFAQGNIVLTDASYRVMTLLRTHRDDSKEYALLPKHIYPVQSIRISEPLKFDMLIQAIAESKPEQSLKSVLCDILPFGNACAEHCILEAGLNPKEKGLTEKYLPLHQEPLELLFQKVKELEEWVGGCWENPPPGFILLEEGKREAVKEEEPVELYHDVVPLLFKQLQSKKYIEYNSFDIALDEYYSKVEVKKIEEANKQAESSAMTRLERTMRDQSRRARGLRDEAEKEQTQAELIELNLDLVDRAIDAVNEVVASGLSWEEIKELIKEEKENGNPVASIIESLQLETNSITVVLDEHLENESDGSEPEEEAANNTKVKLDLSKTAAANARVHFDVRRKHLEKEKKTHEAAEMAIKSAQKKIEKELSMQKSTITVVHELRKPEWFEKFNWFISSENYIVISGRDALQNEIIVKKYLKSDDVYVHAELHGASSTVILNYRPNLPIPPSTLQQAGMACVCRSKAWDSKIVSSAWWVYAHQVSKTAPTGQYLTTGSFMIRGKKNFLPPVHLVFGFGIMFKLEESCIASHIRERAARDIDPDDLLLADALKKEVVSGLDNQGEEDAVKEISSNSRVSVLEAFLEGSPDVFSVNKAQRKSKSSLNKDTPQSQNIKEDIINGSERKNNDSSFARDKSQKNKDSEKKSRESKGANLKNDPFFDEEDDEAKIIAELLQSSGKKKTRSERKAARKERLAVKKAEKINIPGAKKLEEMGEDVEEVLNRARALPYIKKSEIENFNTVPESENLDVSDEEGKVGSDTEIVESRDIRDEGDKSEIKLEEQVVSGGLNDEGSMHGTEENTNFTRESVANSLTGCPKEEDTILFALPVCGPYEAFNNYKYKLKLMPGPMKKGVAGKQIINLLSHVDGAGQRDVEMIRRIAEVDISHCLLGNVKINMPGMQKIAEKSKKSKKKK